MRYVSTRGRAPDQDFSGVLLAGLADDGGLYLPGEWPHFTHTNLRNLRRLPYADLAAAVIAPFAAPALAPETLLTLCRAAYAGFTHPAIVPLVQIGPTSVGPGIVPRPDPRLQRPGHAAARPPVRPRAHRPGRAHHHPGRDIRRYRQRRHRGLPEPRPRRYRDPASEGPHQRSAAPADDHRHRRRTSATSPSTAISTIARTW